MQSKIQQFLQECRELEGIGQNPGSSRSGVKQEQKISRDSGDSSNIVLLPSNFLAANQISRLARTWYTLFSPSH